MDPKINPDLLKIYDSLPGLLEMAAERARVTGGYTYELQDELQEEYTLQGKLYRWSMPYRSLFECPRCGYTNTQVLHRLVNPELQGSDPSLHMVALTEQELHHIREHGAAFSKECQQFLLQVAAGDDG